ncbi:MAG: UDP-3-O-(3-hydroxymyristoyl)glucosamine N-acyltransferase [Blastocatellia bacterium]|nr:UDP-3-O-(3-hydroxymyristoyl)glucosamine N-acyltransferase [Blastocatellia bacterium]MCS7158023.1 UDP-3-O-(3-hydroxymyristoyl)glucosamine N-acyltransferase [Blastocatellia bacterium]MCX7752530.1 UDP-3-O-(3-hydroxymyristoyl)glucosamine N-acyltransferase [Blastocatellia bacterium]MDW8167355.1 UDP-3-O-(3-hydroxymyristoyl)glucosamine N-acyltransferase [Acidobacteriota bacterium]MDW8257320.1 UDP-3-O-(3-hydroxymyristoyl)glucosamine N-acyltransferase [Acidobacteriota bacterium]
MRLSDIARHIGARLDGEDLEITGIAPIAEAQPGELTFIANPKYAPLIKTTRASAVIVAEDFAPFPIALLRTPHPYFAFAKALELFYQAPQPEPGIHPTAIIHPTVKLGAHVTIGAYTVIAAECEIGDHVTIYPHCMIYPNVRIGAHTIIHSQVTVREHTIIGAHVIIHNGARIGTDGFGYARDPEGRWYKIPQAGRVIIHDGVEIGANTTIDRAAIGETVIARDVKIDNLVQIGHGSKVGENSLLCAQVGLAGSTEIGRNVMLAGQVGVAGHLRIGDNVIATAQTGIPSSVEANRVVSGYPAIENKLWLRASAIFARLPEMYRQLREMRQRLERLERGSE